MIEGGWARGLIGAAVLLVLWLLFPRWFGTQMKGARGSLWEWWSSSWRTQAVGAVVLVVAGVIAVLLFAR